MQVYEGDRTVTSSGVTAKGQFGISQKSQAHIMTILRDTLYSDKILAVLREYSSNAWDAHRMVMKGDVPISVTLPEYDSPTLVIRDFGPGMSPDEIFNVYTQYGESTKRDTNDAVGMMGIGSKSAFAYSDSFTVTSWNGGKKRSYVAVLDESNIGEIQCLGEMDCPEDETGIEIQVPVSVEDIVSFRIKAINLFKYFNPQPTINTELPKFDVERRKSGFVSTNVNEWIAVMGCIPYRLNLTQVQADLEAAGMWAPLQKIKGGLNFKIGEVNISASREELKYTDFTKKAIVKKFGEMIDEHIDDAMNDIRNPDLPDWDKRIRSNFMTHVMGFKLPKDFHEWSKPHVAMWGYRTGDNDESVPAPKTFIMFKGTNTDGSTNSVTVAHGSNTRFVVRDDDRPINGFNFGAYDYVVRPFGNHTVEEVTAELTECIRMARLVGIPVVNLSDAGISWYKPYERPADRVKIRKKNPKHKMKAFKWADNPTETRSEHSLNWEPHTWTPSDSDVYVEIRSFIPVNHGRNFWTVFNTDKKVATFLGVTMPPIYGYRSTVNAPVDLSTVVGVEYDTWRGEFFHKALKNSKPHMDMLQSSAVVKEVLGSGKPSGLDIGHIKIAASKMATILPSDHNFITAISSLYDACMTVYDKWWQYSIVLLAASIAKIEVDVGDFKKVMDSYPIIFRVYNVQEIYKSPEEWAEYVMMCDLMAEHRAKIVSIADSIFAEDNQVDLPEPIAA